METSNKTAREIYAEVKANPARARFGFGAKGWPVVWTYVAYMESGEDAGVWGTRTNTADSLQNIKHGSRRAEFDPRAEVDRVRDVIYCKKMASVFFET